MPEYCWQAAWSFFGKGERAAEEWVADQARKILHGKSGQVAAGIRRRATTSGYSPAERASAGQCARYPENKQGYLDYATALARGWPIATGIIEGACRHIVKDRMDITGARWGLGVYSLGVLSLDPPANSGRSFPARFLHEEFPELNRAASILPLACSAACPGS